MNTKQQDRFFVAFDHQAKAEGNEYQWQLRRRQVGRSSKLIMSLISEEEAIKECAHWNKNHSDDIEVLST
jgi:hypothetical protein